MKTIEAEIDTVYGGITLTVSGAYNPESFHFERYGQISHAGTDLMPVLDSDARDAIYEQADSAYEVYLKGQWDRLQEGMGKGK